MKRRDFAKMLGGAVAVSPAVATAKLPRFLNRKRYFGRFDYGADQILMDPMELWESRMGILLLDGKQINSVVYANTHTGIIRTFDVLHDGSAATPTVRAAEECGRVNVVDISSHDGPQRFSRKIAVPVLWKPEDFPGRDVECPPDGVLCETLHGEVEIWGPELA